MEAVIERRTRDRGAYDEAVTRLFVKIRMIRDTIVNGHDEQQPKALPIGQEGPSGGAKS